VYASGIAARRAYAVETPRHSALVRVTHWLNALSFVGLVISGIGILLAHPRFYWGETGGWGSPYLFNLPLPWMPGGPSGWGRHMHFQSAWVCVLTGMLYLVSGVASRHFRDDLLPSARDLTRSSLRATLASQLQFKRSSAESALRYDVLERSTYLIVVFALFPLMIWTGLAMSPAITSVFPVLVTTLGGHQCARTIHFFTAIMLVLFVLVHIAMVWRAGFRRRVGAMISGRLITQREDE
jgi:thiosulfate reductase cytochrome b subunit